MIKITTEVCDTKFEEIPVEIYADSDNGVVIDLLDKTFDIQTIRDIVNHMEYLDKITDLGEE